MSDASELFNYVGGGAGLVAAAAWAVRALGARVVEREDADKKAMQAKLDEREKEQRAISEALIGIKHDVGALRTGQDQLARQMESRAETQDKEITSLRAEVKEQINQLEHRLRSDMQRLVSVPPARSRGRG